jgi:hypothetical protein
MSSLLVQIANYLQIPHEEIETCEEKYLKITNLNNTGFAEDIFYSKETDVFGNVKVTCQLDNSSNSSLVCKQCKNNNDFAEDNGEIICKNCGLVLIDHIINESYIGVIFDKDGAIMEDAPAVGDLPKKHLPAWYNNGIASSKLKGDGKKYGKATSDEHKVKQILKFSKEIKEIAGLFQLSDIIQSAAADYFSEMRRYRERIHTSSLPFIIFACLKKAIQTYIDIKEDIEKTENTDKLFGYGPQFLHESPKSFCKSAAECIVRGGYVPECYLCGTRFESLQRQREHKCPCIPIWIQNQYIASNQSQELEKQRIQRMLRKRKLVTDYNSLGSGGAGDGDGGAGDGWAGTSDGVSGDCLR